jgi:surface antigen
MAAPNLGVSTLSLDTASQRSLNAKGLAPSPKAFTVTGATSVAITHCSTLWSITADNRLISGAPTWVPNPTGAWPVVEDSEFAATAYNDTSLKTFVRAWANNATRHAVKVPLAGSKSKPRPRPAPRPAPYGPPPGGIGPWVPVPGHPSYTFHDFAGDPHSAEFGTCTWWAWYMRRDESALGTLGMARDWIANARARGMRTGYTPAVGATAVFQPGVQGAGGGGHAAHVVAVLSNGWFIISEMNFYWNGGGWGRVDYRYVHTGSGVAFIY